MKRERILKISRKLRELEPSTSPERMDISFPINNKMEMVSFPGESIVGPYTGHKSKEVRILRGKKLLNNKKYYTI